MEEESNVVTDTAKEETVKLVFEILGTIATIFVMKSLMGGDWQRIVMRGALITKTLAIKQANWWLAVSDKADRLYENQRFS